MEIYFNAIFRINAIRTCYDALKIINISQSIVPVPPARLKKDAFDQPLLTLLPEERISIAKLVAFSAKTWPVNLHPIFFGLLKKLNLPETAKEIQISVKIFFFFLFKSRI